MRTVLKKHVVTGLGVDIWLTKEIELWIPPITGLSVRWGSEIEKVLEVAVDLDCDETQLWVEPDHEVLISHQTKDQRLERLAVKVRELQNRGWTVSR